MEEKYWLSALYQSSAIQNISQVLKWKELGQISQY